MKEKDRLPRNSSGCFRTEGLSLDDIHELKRKLRRPVSVFISYFVIDSFPNIIIRVCVTLLILEFPQNERLFEFLSLSKLEFRVPGWNADRDKEGELSHKVDLNVSFFVVL
jgi:hypothetical protein